MSGVSKVEILCPNGHRVVVNVTHSTRLLQVLEECCLKKSLGSPEGFMLKHNRKQLDLALPVYQLGLTNMAKLELVKAEATREDAKVRIGLEVANESGRLQREFDALTSLSDVVASFEKENGRGGQLDLTRYRTDNHSPVIVYVNEEVLGDYALQSTTLKMLGIFRGSHLLKLSFKVISDEKLSEVRQKIDQEKGRISRLTAKAAAASASDKSHSSPPPPPSIETPAVRSEEAMDVVTPTPGFTGVTPDALVGCTGGDYGNAAVQSVTPENVPSTTVATSQNDTRGDSFSTVYRRQDDPWVLPAESSSSQWVLPQPQFATFKFPEETKGKDIYRNEFSEVNREDFLPCDRETVLFSLNEPEAEILYEDDVGDDFFEHTVSDLKALQASLSKEVMSIDDQPLMTQAMRNAQRNARMSSYERFIVRFEFPDRLVLQAVFRPAETVSSLYKFVKETLAEKNLDFELYTTPPRIVLEDRAQTLIEAALGPLALVHFKARSQTEEPYETGYLAIEVLNRMSCRADAKNVLGKHLPPRKKSAAQSGPDRSSDRVPGPSSSQSASSTRGQPGSNSAAPGATGNVPKWFKSGLK